jgi:hypothetical protein
MIDREDDELRASFHQLREEDVRRAPAFPPFLEHAESVARPPIRRSAATRTFRLLALAAGIVLVLGVTREVSRRVRAAAVPSITTWRSPTQGLLRTSDRDLLAPPPLLTSVLGATARAPIQRKGE